MIIRKFTYLIAGLIAIQFHSTAQYSVIDSLEEVAKNAKPGWDEVDYSVGLARLYIGGSGSVEDSRRHIDNLYRIAREENIPEARAYGLVMENLFHYIITNDIDKSINAVEEALRIGKENKCNDVVVFAGYQLAERYFTGKGDLEKSAKIMEGILPYMDETVDIKHKANGFKTLGYAYTRIGKEKKGFAYLDSALLLFDKMKTDPFIDPRINRVSSQYGDIDNLKQYALNMIGRSKLRLGYPEEARQYQERALQLGIKSGRPRIISWQYEQIGISYELRGYYDKALENFQEARILLEQTELKHHLAFSNYLLARVMTRLEDYNSAENYMQQALDLYERTNDTLFSTKQYLLGSQINAGAGNLTLAEKYMTKADQFIPYLDGKEIKAEYLNTKGILAEKKGDMNKALTYYKRFQSISEEIGFILYELESTANMAQTYYLIENYDSALYFSQKVLQDAKNQSNIAFTRTAYQLISDIYEKTKDYESALQNFKLFFAFDDSVYNADAQVKLKEEQVRRDVEGIRTEKELVEANAALLKQQNNLYLIVGGVFLGILVLVSFLYLNLRKAKSKIDSQNRERETLLKEIHHRVKNNLQIISSILNIQSRKLEDDSARSAVKEGRSRIKTMSLIHEKLYSTSELSVINMKEYIHELSEFLVKTYRPDNNISREIETEEIVLDIDQAIPVGLILNELISNSLKYAFDSKGGSLKIRMLKKFEQLHLEVSDNGIGLPENFNDIKSMGMRLVNSLTEQIEGVLDIKTHPGTSFIIRFNPAVSK